MFPAPNSTISVKDFGAIRALDQSYADLLEKEYAFCKKNEQAIIKKARKEHALHKYCCNFPLLEAKHDEWVALNYLIG